MLIFYIDKNVKICLFSKKYRDFWGQFIMPFCFGRKNVQLEIVKINSELLKIKKIKRVRKRSTSKVQSNLRQNLAKNLAIDTNGAWLTCAF
jgi:hypothetical protein